MSRSDLPEGVAPDNSPKSSFSSSNEVASEFTAPDMATPEFAKPERLRMDAKMDAQALHVVHDEAAGEDETPIKLFPSGSMTVAVIIALALLLVGFATVIYAANNRQTLPLCSTQPEWNQYNCRAG